MKTNKRASKGGEYGANGEWYEGGKFIATTDHAKKHGSQKKKTSRSQIEPGVWVELEYGTFSYWSQLAGIERFDRAANTFTFQEGLGCGLSDADHVVRRKEWIAAYNRGERTFVKSAP